MTCPSLCRVLAKELFSNSDLAGCRVHAFDHCPCFSLRNFILAIGGGVHIYLLSIQCHIAPRLLNLSLIAGSQCVLPGYSLRKSSPTLSHGGPESWLAALSKSGLYWGMAEMICLRASFPFSTRFGSCTSLDTDTGRQAAWILASCQARVCLPDWKVPSLPWSCLLDHRKGHGWPAPALSVTPCLLMPLRFSL